ncbi:MAG TPA: recombinase family protein, partial [Anaerolineales bacterium]
MSAESPFLPGSRVAAYLRDSGHEEQELSIAQQEAEIRRWCENHQLVLTKIFRDEARPGSSVVGRQQFQEMIRYFREGAQEQGVLIWKFSRFARDQDDSQFYKADLRRRGYIVHALMDKIPGGPEGRFFEAALDWMNQKFLDDLSEDVKRGLRHLVEQYGCVPGVPPRGIRRVPVVIGKRRDGREHVAHRWEPDPAWVGRVRQAFELKAQGASLDTIRRETGLYRSVNSYKTFFTNKIWLGILEYGAEVVIVDYCEPVITQALWERVQVRLREHAQKQHVHSDRLHPRRKNSRFLLSGLVFCPRCGSAFSGSTSKNGYGQTYERYGCGRRKRRGDCDMPWLPRFGLEKAVIEQLLAHVLQ